jgi:hypothetical protein
MVLSFYGRMRVIAGPAADPRARFVAANRTGPTRLTRRDSLSRIGEQRAKSVRVVIVTSTFLVLLAGGLLIGGHAAIDPLLHSIIEAPEANGVGHVVYTMPDGIYCRHVAFDNVTAELTESAIEPCKNDIAARGRHAGAGFTWRTN